MKPLRSGSGRAQPRSPGAVELLQVAIAALVLVAPTQAARAEGDAKEGAQVFNQCKICHGLEPGKNRVGPSLNGLFGRKAGTAPGYPYSAAMRNSGLTWSEDTLARYLADPQKTVPGNKMAFPGVKDPNRLGDLLAYLKQATRQSSR